MALYRILETTRTNLAAQQRVVEELRSALKELHAQQAVSDLDFGRTARAAADEMRAMMADLRSGLANGSALARAGGTDEDVSASAPVRPGGFVPFDKIADRGVAVMHVDGTSMYAASPSIVKLEDGRLLTVLERSISWGHNEEGLVKHVFASDDRGVSWAEVGTLRPMNWPQVFRCASGVYVIGTERHFSHDNNLVISRMLDQRGASWSTPVKLTEGRGIVTANGGIDVSNGRVTKAIELIPSMSSGMKGTTLKTPVTLPFRGGPRSSSWQHPPVLRLELESVEGFVPFILIQATEPDKKEGARSFFFRVLEVDAESASLVVRLERFNHYLAKVPVLMHAGWSVKAGSGAFVYGGVDWLAMAMGADETADLTDPAVWTFSAPLGNPASVYTNEMRVLFDVAFRPDADVRKSILGADVQVANNEEAFEAGFGSLYWMEGVITRQRDRHGGNGKLLAIMRVNNDLLCDLAALIEYDDAEPGQIQGRFLRYTNVPGLGVAHPTIVYDEQSDLYWMVTNVNRDSVREWRQPAHPSTLEPKLHITAFSKCEIDRTTSVLFYSPNLIDWVMAGVVDYHVRLSRHFSYPHMIVDGPDLLVVSRASFTPWRADISDRLPEYFNNHNSNSISFHRVRNFRSYANAAWANERGPYSGTVRKSTNSVGSLVHTLVSGPILGDVVISESLNSTATAGMGRRILKR